MDDCNAHIEQLKAFLVHAKLDASVRAGSTPTSRFAITSEARYSPRQTTSRGSSGRSDYEPR
jgi:hypothetical protein